MEENCNWVEEQSLEDRATAFLSSIPLDLISSCEQCISSNMNAASEVRHPLEKTPYVSQIEDDAFPELPAGQGDALQALNTALFKPRNNQFYKRSISSTADIALAQTSYRQRHLSLTEMTPSSVLCLGDDYSEVSKAKSQAPVLKMNFIMKRILLSNRIFLVENVNNTPSCVFSILPYTKESQKFRSAVSVENAKFMQTASFEHQNVPGVMDSGSAPTAKQVISYDHLLVPSLHEPVVSLDCAEWMSGKHRTVLALQSYMISVIGYTKPSELKRNLNTQFKSSFPGVNITLSKLRSLERQMCRAARLHGLQAGVLMCGKTYFERLVFSGLVNKTNRQQAAASCLLLSAKVNGDLQLNEIPRLFVSLEQCFKCTKSAIISVEFSIFAALKFSLLPFRNRIRRLSGD